MVRHVILWKIKGEYSDEQKAVIKAEAKNNLEALKGKVPGLCEITIHTEALPSSNADLMLDSVLENEEVLKGYAVHPEHVKVADTYVRPFMEIRMCMDFGA